MTVCTRCEGTGFLNLFQIENITICDAHQQREEVQAWIVNNDDHDVSVCDCCGDGEAWHGTPGEHYGSGDRPGDYGPYAYNGGLCECH